jgi:hypothetical protein
MRVTVIFDPATAPGGGGSHFLRLAEAAATSVGIALNAAPVHDVAGAERVIAAVARRTCCLVSSVFTKS